MTSTTEFEIYDFSNLPLDAVFKISRYLEDDKSRLAMRATCSSWRRGVTTIDTLRPAGLQSQPYASFPGVTTIDYTARGQSTALSNTELSSALSHNTKTLGTLNLSGAFKITDFSPLSSCHQLTALSLRETLIQDTDLLHLPPNLIKLGLTNCMYLQGSFITHLHSTCPLLQHLNLTSCGLSLHQDTPTTAAPLALLGNLRSLYLGGGNGVNDEIFRILGALRNLEVLSVRDADGVTLAGLDGFVDAWEEGREDEDGGNDEEEDSGGASTTTTTINTTARNSRCPPLRELDLSGCTRVTENVWHIIQRLKNLRKLHLNRMPQLFALETIADDQAGAMWRLPNLEHLSLCGSGIHPTKLLLVAAACGGTLQSLNISSGGGVDTWSQPRRLSAQHIQSYAEALRQFKQLRSFEAAGTGLHLAPIVSLLRSASQKLEHLDLSGCDLQDYTASTASSTGTHGQHQWLSAPAPVRRSLTMQFYDHSFSGTSDAAHRLEAHQSETGMTSVCDFAYALGFLGNLKVLELQRCFGLTDVHLGQLGRLGRLERLVLARNRAITSQVLPVNNNNKVVVLGEGEKEVVAVSDDGQLSSKTSSSSSSSVISTTTTSSISISRTLSRNKSLPSSPHSSLLNLTYLNINGITMPEGALLDLSQYPKLKHLHMADIPSVSSTALIATLATIPPSCQHEEEEHKGEEEDSSSGGGGGGKHTALETLNLSGCIGVDDTVLAAIASNCPLLTSLHLAGCIQLTSSAGALQSLAALHHLKCLDLDRCFKALDDHLINIIGHAMPQLTKLSLGGSRGGSMTVVGLEGLLDRLPLLGELDLTGCQGGLLTDDVLNDVLPGVTGATVQMPNGARSPSGSPVKRWRQPGGGGVVV